MYCALCRHQVLKRKNNELINTCDIRLCCIDFDHLFFKLPIMRPTIVQSKPVGCFQNPVPKLPTMHLRNHWRQFIKLHTVSSGDTKGLMLLFSHIQSYSPRPLNTGRLLIRTPHKSFHTESLFFLQYPHITVWNYMFYHLVSVTVNMFLMWAKYMVLSKQVKPSETTVYHIPGPHFTVQGSKHRSSGSKQALECTKLRFNNQYAK